MAAVPLLSLGHARGHLYRNHDGAGHGRVVEARAGHVTLLHGLYLGRICVVAAVSVALITRSLRGASIV